MERIILVAAFAVIYYHIGGLATTNILRLTAGNTLPVLSSRCVCGCCGMPITPFYQLPILSYILCKGKCRQCETKIPLDGLALEVAVWLGMFAISAALRFSFLGVTLSFLYYEILRVVLVWKKGGRETALVRQYIIAVLAMIPIYLITLFVAVIYFAVLVR